MTLDSEISPADPARRYVRAAHLSNAHSTDGGLKMHQSNGTGTAGQPLRLLIPITATEDSRWGIRYALRLRAEGIRIEVIFLNVGEIITDWQALRFRSQAEFARFQSERAQTFIDEASAQLLEHDIPFRGLFRRGDPVFCIPDVAEEMDCQQIVLPRPPGGICSFFSQNITGSILQKNHIPRVITVDQDGQPTVTGKNQSVWS